VATITAQVGDLEVAEDAVQDACAAALAQWPATGMPASPQAWLIGTARHKALDRLRREHRRAEKEAEAVREAGAAPPPGGWPTGGGDELGLIFTCCHPALDPAARVALTLRSVCGLTTAEIAAGATHREGGQKISGRAASPAPLARAGWAGRSGRRRARRPRQR
jgi:RNA polymerase sigma-70 factor (ECF subfamily)